ncbi:MAG: prolipoprotein diacylglyceryl transferase [Synechococcales cyanobacterium T60_A2020_003]|nr:prolipoprotein diacylglyceryl transferase [Synechococcales cyanobacterium T60_A2020_003]
MVLQVLPLAFEFASPGRILVQLGPLSIRWYGALIAIAVVVGLNLSRWLSKKRNMDPELVTDLAFWLVLAAIPCARLYYVLFEWSYYSQHPNEILAVWKGGIAIHGAVLGGILATIIFARLNRVSFWQLADVVAPSLILGQAIGRWGNFFNSEAFGRPTDLPWKLYIPPEQRPRGYADFSYFHPTFLYESLWNIGVFSLLITLFFWGLRRPGRLKPGTIFLTYWVGYSLGRFWIEGLRMDSLMLGSLRIAQVISLVGITVGVAGLVWLYGLGRSLPDVPRIEPHPVKKNPEV